MRLPILSWRTIVRLIWDNAWEVCSKSFVSIVMIYTALSRGTFRSDFMFFLSFHWRAYVS